MIDKGQIVKNLIPSEPVIVNKVQKLGTMVSISYTGVNSNKANSKVIAIDDFNSLIVLSDEGSFNFTGDPVNFAL